MSILVLGLEVTRSDICDVLLRPIVDVASHGGPIHDPLNIIRHDPSILKITTRLNPFN